MQVITSKDTEIEDLREQLAETKKLEADLRESKVCVCMVRHEGAIVGLKQCVPWTGTGSTTRASVLTHTYMSTNQADLEKTENDLAESKKVRALAGRGTASKTQKILAGQ